MTSCKAIQDLVMWANNALEYMGTDRGSDQCGDATAVQLTEAIKAVRKEEEEQIGRWMQVTPQPLYELTSVEQQYGELVAENIRIREELKLARKDVEWEVALKKALLEAQEAWVKEHAELTTLEGFVRHHDKLYRSGKAELTNEVFDALVDLSFNSVKEAAELELYNREKKNQ